MTFISYAQNFEDVMLWRALKHIQNGFYIDVGAAWPDEHSVTKAFYERGWCGINLEPNPEFYKRLHEERPRDRNLELAIGEKESTQRMTFFLGTGLSTLDDSIAQLHNAGGWDALTRDVKVTTLASVWDQHIPQGQDVHFLKVDVEGFEEAALRGNHWTKNRPWVVVVEATVPLSNEESYQSWETILTQASYVLAYADGLNRFYLALEHQELLNAFKYPPNVFDEFKLHSQQAAENLVTQTEARAIQAEDRAIQAEDRLVEITHSLSWRMTSPLRALAKLSLKLPINPCKQRIKSLLQHAALYVGRRPRLRRIATAVLGRFPAIKRRLTVIATNRSMSTTTPQNVPTELAHLTPHALSVLNNLRSALENQQQKRK